MTVTLSAAGIAPFIDITGAKSPAVSPDGGLLAYLCDESGTHQIWVRSLEEGAARQVTDHPEPIGTLAFNPRSRDIVFASDCGGDERHQLFLLEDGAREPVALTEGPDVVHAWGAFSPDGSRIAFTANRRDPFHMDVYTLDLETRRTSRVFEGTGWREVVAFSPDGASLLLRDRSRGSHDQDLLRLDLASGVAEPLLERVGRTKYAAARIRKDGTGVYLVADRGRDFAALGFHRFGTGVVEWLASAENADIEAMALSPDQRSIAFVTNREGWSALTVLDLETGRESEAQGLPACTISSLAWLPDGSGLVFPMEGATLPAAIGRWPLDGGRIEKLAEGPAGALDRAAFVEPRVDRVPSFDGLDIPVFVYEPRGAAPAGGRPALVIVHGGPEAQWLPGFRADIQYLVAQGVLVIAPNVRGSTGYGRAYEHLDDRDKRMDAVADLTAVGRWVAARADVDAARVGVFGRSYGGFMVLAALTEEPGLWSLGVDFYGIANFETLLEITGPWRRAQREVEYGSLTEDSDLLRRISPIRKIDRVAAPLLLVHGSDDPRVPPSESEMVFSALRGRAKQVELLRIPHEGHGFARAENRQRVFGELADFLGRHL